MAAGGTGVTGAAGLSSLLHETLSAGAKGVSCVISLPHERFGATWAFDQIGFDLVELPEVVTWPQSSKERPSRK